MKTIEKQPHSRAYLNHRKLMLVLPILVVPFLTFGFWSLGGGKGVQTEQVTHTKGFNTVLPDADIAADSTLDKMAFYDLAIKDSIQKTQEDQRDPYAMAQGLPQSAAPDATVGSGYNSTPAGYGGRSYNDPNERRVQEKLAALNASLNEAASPKASPPLPDPYRNTGSAMNTADIDRLEGMMNSMQNSGAGSDPEMQQISTMLNQILDIQHPDRVQEKIRQNSRKNAGQVFAVSATGKANMISNLDNRTGNSLVAQNGFFSINEPVSQEKDQNAIEAVVHETQVLTAGAIVKLRLVNDIYISGQLIPKNTFVFGTASINGERLMIEVGSLRYGKSLYPVKLGVYDLDGLDGIHIPGAIGRDVAKNSTDEMLRGISMGSNSIDPSLGVQAMGAGIEAAKSLISKKVKLVKVTVKAGYHVLLKDANQK